MRNVAIILRRELAAYFTQPVAYVFLVIFAALAGGLAFHVGGFLERGQANLDAFFTFHPWLYLFLIPALAMRLWAEERRSGTLELLITLPVTPAQAVLGKFLAAWLFAGVALLLTLPLWVTVAWLGDPDHGVILAGYLGSWLLAGGFLAVGSALSALTRNQVVAFILAATACFLLLLAGAELVQRLLRSLLPEESVALLAGLSAQTHFLPLTQGDLALPHLVYFASLIVCALIANTLLVQLRKGR